MPSKIRFTAVGVLLFALASSTVQALPAIPQARAQRHAESADLMTAAWDWLVSLLTPHLPTLPTSPAGQSGQKEGSQMDPNGGG
jgi:hypothetical protein